MGYPSVQANTPWRAPCGDKSKTRERNNSRGDAAAHARQAISQPDGHRLPMVQRTTYMKRVMGPEMLLSACQKEDGNAMYMLEKPLDISGVAEESSFFEDGTLPNQSISLADLPTGAGELVHGGPGGLGYSRLKPEGCQRSSEAWWRRCLLVSPALCRGQDPEGAARFRPRSAHLKRRKRPSRCAWGFRGSHGKPLCRKTGGIQPFELESKLPQGCRLRKYCRRTRPKLSATVKRSVHWGDAGNPSSLHERHASLLWTSFPTRRPSEARATHREKRGREV